MVVLGLSGAVPGVHSASQDDAPTLTRTVVLDGLDAPWDLAFTPDGALLVTEKCRGLSVRRADGTLALPVRPRRGGSRRARFLLPGPERGAWRRGRSCVRAQPLRLPVHALHPCESADQPRRAPGRGPRLHDGQRAHRYRARHPLQARGERRRRGWHAQRRPLRFGPDGFLYITTGDNHQPTLPQDLTRLGGKVLRVDRDGRPAPGNHTPAGGDPRIYTYGHRNVQDITFRPGTGQPFVAEHGPNHTDEVTPLVAGGNGGWDPQQRPQLRCPDDYCGYAGDATTMPMTDTTRFPEAMRPSWTNEGESEGMGPCTFLTGAPWGAWEGRLAVGFLAGQRVEVLDLDAAGMTTSHTRMDLPRQRIRALVPDPTGDLYIAVDAGAIWRVTPRAP